MIVAVVAFWGSLAALAWTHAFYPLTVALAARVRTRRVARDDAYLPTVAVIVTAYNEEGAIERRLENLRALDYPPELLEIVVTSDASTDRTEELAAAAGARVIRNPRGGKVAAQDAAVRATEAEIVAFSDANATWAPDAVRKLVRNFADPRVAYVCGRLRLEAPDGSNKEGVYWRYELVTRAGESSLGSVTAGNGAIYALRRSDYVEVDPRFGHDLSLPYLMVQHGRRAVYEPEALAFERPTPDERERVPAQGADVRALVAHRAAWADAAPPAARLSPRARLAPAPALRERAAPSPPARELPRVARARRRLRGRPRSPARPARGSSRRGGDRALLRPDHVGDRRRALELPAARRARDVGAAAGGARVNRAADVALAGGALLVSSPLLALAALAIKLEDRGPVLYRQTRVGRDGSDFELLKLRTMVVGAETMGAGLGVNRGDARITRTGRILRKLSLDELPQLWNVVRGEMSVIGPRPTLRYQVEQYDERQRHRLDVKPGITGWAQVNGRATLPWAERIELDVWYVEHRSPLLDLRILARTPFALFGGTYKGDTGGWHTTP